MYSFASGHWTPIVCDPRSELASSGAIITNTNGLTESVGEFFRLKLRRIVGDKNDVAISFYYILDDMNTEHFSAKTSFLILVIILLGSTLVIPAKWLGVKQTPHARINLGDDLTPISTLKEDSNHNNTPD